MRTFLPMMVLSSILFIALGGCGGDAETPAGATGQAAPETYTVRGVVKATNGDEVTVQHEAIPGFKGRDGKAAEMASMTMAFGVGEGVDRGVLTPGGKASFTIEVHWDKRPALRITGAEALPADTALILE